MHGVMIAIEYNIATSWTGKNILIYGANKASYCSDSHIYQKNADRQTNGSSVL